MTNKFKYRGTAFTRRSFLHQALPGACGVAVVANYVRLIDRTRRHFKEREVVAAMDKAPNLQKGISETAIAAALLRLGYFVDAHFDAVLDVALARNAPMIACVDRYEHWVVIVRRVRSICIVIDSDSATPVVYSLPLAELDRRWRHGGMYYSMTATRSVAPRR